MPIEGIEIDTLIVGAGQAGLAMSAHLHTHNITHLIVERKRIAERWRSERWDSFVANGPAWHDRFPEYPFANAAPDDFPTKTQIVNYFEQFAASINAPVRCGVTVEALYRNSDKSGFRAETSEGPIECRRVVVATGAFQKPVVPGVIPHESGIIQMHSSEYRNPSQLPPGAVLVVGGGSSGVQIVDEILHDGRRVYLSVGNHKRPPRRYRGQDSSWWLDRLGRWDMRPVGNNTKHVPIAVSGSNGGWTVDFRELAQRGVVLLGHTESYRDGVLHFAPDLRENIEKGEQDYLSFLKECDELIEREGLDFPEEREAHQIMADSACLNHPQLEIDLKKEGISVVIWATGYSSDFEWVRIDDAFDPSGRPCHDAGVSCVPGLYFIGLPFLSRLGSAFIFGVWDDAKHLSKHVAQIDSGTTG
ncbi:hypothetical protein N0V82_006237 [Gnomoniopsis sp. IMI 355080]|nr:hypothetical protein N0V82_006237 [Gnomoniopsis sp. IMI 355080]